MKTSIVLILILLNLLFFHCEKQKPVQNDAKFAGVVKEMEIILAGNEPDSLKCNRITKLMQDRNVTIEEYRGWVNYYTEKNPMQSMQLLQDIETQIQEEIKTSAKKFQKKEMTNSQPKK